MELSQQVLILKALSDETRLSIVTMLSKNNLCACQLLEDFDLSQATLSYHMKQLQECELVSGKKDGYWTRYSLNKNTLLPLVKVFDALVEDVTVASPLILCRGKNSEETKPSR